VQIAFALLITFISACLLNLGYLLQHSVASQAPPLSLRHPGASVRSLLGNRRWLLGLATEAAGWLLYVAALALAPLSLVQATAAGGIGILAIMVARVTHVPLSGRERMGALLSACAAAPIKAIDAPRKSVLRNEAMVEVPSKLRTERERNGLRRRGRAARWLAGARLRKMPRPAPAAGPRESGRPVACRWAGRRGRHRMAG